MDKIEQLKAEHDALSIEISHLDEKRNSLALHEHEERDHLMSQIIQLRFSIVRIQKELSKEIAAKTISIKNRSFK